MLEDPDLISVQEVRSKVLKAYAAWQTYRNFSQEQIDKIVDRAAAAARQHSKRLAELAVTETGYGNARDKTAKNLLASDLLAKTMHGMRTVGVLREDAEKKVVEIGVPMGVVAAILPTTNPTSTAIYKTLIALKAGNAVVVSPHPRAKQCTCETVAVMHQAAVQAGLPEDAIQCITSPSMEATTELMRHKRTAVILSTGGSGIVRAAYSSGKPAFGVGPGNVPVLIDPSAELGDAVAKVIAGKSFDYGTLCSSEQTVIAEESLRDRLLTEFKSRKAFLCNDQQAAALGRVLLVAPTLAVCTQCVGQPPTKIAQMAGFEVPADTSIILAEIKGIGREHPLSAEKLSPVLSLYFVKDFRAALDAGEAVLRFGGLGHTCGIYAKDETRIREYAQRMPAMRVICNTPTPQGSVGITTNLFPAMTLGCGAVAGNITGDNISPKHLINIKRLAYVVRNPEDAFDMPDIKTAAAVGSTASRAGAPDRMTIASAVERYLAKKGVKPAAPDESRSRVSAAEVVDQFLSSKKPADSVATRVSEPPPAAPAKQPDMRPPVGPPEPEVKVADFVCENDVRVAVQNSQKIYIGPKSIVTPSARDLANQHDILVVAKRS